MTVWHCPDTCLLASTMCPQVFSVLALHLLPAPDNKFLPFQNISCHLQLIFHLPLPFFVSPLGHCRLHDRLRHLRISQRQISLMLTNCYRQSSIDNDVCFFLDLRRTAANWQRGIVVGSLDSMWLIFPSRKYLFRRAGQASKLVGRSALFMHFITLITFFICRLHDPKVR